MASENVQDITVVESDSGDDAGSESSEEFNFAVALALRKNLTETFDKHVHSSNVSKKIAALEQQTAAGSNNNKLPPRQPQPARNDVRPNSTPLGVYLRIRPPPSASSSTTTETTLEILPTSKPNDVPTTVRTYPPVDSNAAKVVRTSDTGVKEFQFAQVFGPDSQNIDVYSTVAAPLVSGLFPSSEKQGESALLFAYGITNAGKTHTIMGDIKNDNPGVIPRALQDIFAHMEVADTKYDLNLSYMEIYNEAIFDLLPNNKTNHHVAPLRLRESRDGQTFVRGLAKHQVRDVAHGLQLAQQAGTKRHTSSNNLNTDSSRSHCICQLELVVQSSSVHPAVVKNKDGETTATTNGYTTEEEASQLAGSKDKTVTLWIVDLAGSERSKRTGVTQGSVRQKEAALINSSLMKLMRCLSVMRRNQTMSSTTSVVPFRESKLTHLFMNHLMGPSANRTLMIVNVNPAAADFDETQHVLAYATAARTVQISQEEVRRRKRTEEPTHDYNGRALKRFKSKDNNNKIAKLVRHFSPKKLMPNNNKTSNGEGARKREDPRKRKAEQRKASSRSLASDDDGEPKTKTARLASMRAMNKPKEAAAQSAAPSQDKELKNLKTSLSIAQAEAEVLRSEKNKLEEQLSQRETQVRMEIAQEMEEQMRVTREQYNGIIDNLKRQVQQGNPTPAAKSTKKAQMDKAEKYIEELVDKVDECEEEMVRMRQEHAKEVTTLGEEHAKNMKAKEQELEEVKSCHETAVAALEEKIEQLQSRLKESTENYAKLEKSKKEMMENYERLFREEEEEDDSDEEEEEEDDEKDPTPVQKETTTTGTTARRLTRSTRRHSKVAVETIGGAAPKSSGKKPGRRLRSKRMPFSPVPINENPAAEDESDSPTSEDSFGPEQWLRPRKKVERDASTGTYLRPRGRAPSGREWDEKVGAWRLSVA